MITQDLLDILRCPLSPSHTRLLLRNDHLECERCALCFKIKDGFPILVVEEAELPPGCASIDQLPCQQGEPQPDEARRAASNPVDHSG